MSTTISNLMEYNFRKLSRQSPEVKEGNKNALKYIVELATNTRTNISKWDIQAIFGTKTNHFIQDKNELNKRFFETKAKETIPEIQQNEILDQAAARLMESVKRNFDQERVKRQENISSLLVLADRRRRDMEVYLSQAAQTQLMLDSMSIFTGEKMIEEIHAIERAGFFSLESVSAMRVSWITVNPITLREVNQAAGLNYSVHFGRLRAEIDLTKLSFRVSPVDHVFPDLPYFHPHVSSSGDICFGDASSVANKYLINYQFSAFLELLSQLLVSYSPTAPYMSLDRFHKLQLEQAEETTEETTEEDFEEGEEVLF